MKRKRKKEGNLLYKLTMIGMSVMVAILMYLINVEKKFITKETLSTIKLSTITQFLFWENLFNDEKQQVSMEVSYSLLNDHYYSNGTNMVNAILDGVIVKIDEDNLLQLCDNGVSVSYEKVNSITVKENDRILKGDVLGNIEESVIIHFYIDGKEITMEEAIHLE